MHNFEDEITERYNIFEFRMDITDSCLDQGDWMGELSVS